MLRTTDPQDQLRIADRARDHLLLRLRRTPLPEGPAEAGRPGGGRPGTAELLARQGRAAELEALAALWAGRGGTDALVDSLHAAGLETEAEALLRELAERGNLDAAKRLRPSTAGRLPGPGGSTSGRWPSPGSPLAIDHLVELLRRTGRRSGGRLLLNEHRRGG